MDSFTHARRIEAESRNVVIPELLKRYNAKLEEDLDEQVKRQMDGEGDIILRMPDDKLVSFELKSDRTKWPNVFFEEWSNKSTGRQGWLHTLKVDRLVYHRMLFRECIEFDWPLFQKWAKHNICIYPLKVQGKYVQKNDTYGYCVPILELFKANEEIGLSIWQFKE